MSKEIKIDALLKDVGAESLKKYCCDLKMASIEDLLISLEYEMSNDKETDRNVLVDSFNLINYVWNKYKDRNDDLRLRVTEINWMFIVLGEAMEKAKEKEIEKIKTQKIFDLLKNICNYPYTIDLFAAYSILHVLRLIPMINEREGKLQLLKIGLDIAEDGKIILRNKSKLERFADEDYAGLILKIIGVTESKKQDEEQEDSEKEEENEEGIEYVDEEDEEQNPSNVKEFNNDDMIENGQEKEKIEEEGRKQNSEDISGAKKNTNNVNGKRRIIKKEEEIDEKKDEEKKQQNPSNVKEFNNDIIENKKKEKDPNSRKINDIKKIMEKNITDVSLDRLSKSGSNTNKMDKSFRSIYPYNTENDPDTSNKKYTNTVNNKVLCLKKNAIKVLFFLGITALIVGILMTTASLVSSNLSFLLVPGLTLFGFGFLSLGVGTFCFKLYVRNFVGYDIKNYSWYKCFSIFRSKSIFKENIIIPQESVFSRIQQKNGNGEHDK